MGPGLRSLCSLAGTTYTKAPLLVGFRNVAGVNRGDCFLINRVEVE
jgi:hypothetical protein